MKAPPLVREVSCAATSMPTWGYSRRKREATGTRPNALGARSTRGREVALWAESASDQTGDVGVTFSLGSDGTYLYLKYTSDNSVAGTFKFAIAESYVKTAW